MTINDIMHTDKFDGVPAFRLAEMVETLKLEIRRMETINSRRNELAQGENSTSVQRMNELTRERDDWKQKYSNLFKKVFQPLSWRERFRGRIDLR